MADLDGSAPIELNKYYHVTVLYTGYSMEMYVDGVLDTFKPFSGKIQSSTKPLTISRMDDVETQYALRGSVDEVKLWDKEISVPQIAQLKTQWFTPYGIEKMDAVARIYPNPSNGEFMIEFNEVGQIDEIALIASDGRMILSKRIENQSKSVKVGQTGLAAGLYLLMITLKNGEVIGRKIMVN